MGGREEGREGGREEGRKGEREKEKWSIHLHMEVHCHKSKRLVEITAEITKLAIMCTQLIVNQWWSYETAAHVLCGFFIDAQYQQIRRKYVVISANHRRWRAV